MKYAIISDIHSNLEAFNTVLEHAKEQGCEKYVCGGDVVGYNANPKECMDIVRQMEMPCVMGNHDQYVGEEFDLSSFNPVAAEAVLWTRAQLSEEEREWLRTLRFIRLVDTFAVVHATMDGPRYWGYVQDKMGAAASFTYQTTQVCFHGHTHVPLAFRQDERVEGGTYSRIELERNKKYFINVGSVGQPRDGDPRAAYVIYDTDEKVIELFRLNYDLETAQEKIRAAGLPERLAERLAVGK